MKIYPFTNPLFTYSGYGMHFVGGIWYTTVQVTIFQLIKPKYLLNTAWPMGHMLFSFNFLLVVELAQFFDPTRQVQIEDIIAQTIGILFVLPLLWFFDHNRTSN